MNNNRCPLCKKAICICGKENNNKSMNIITAQALFDIITTRPDTLIINVLDAATFNDCHIKGSVNIPLDELDKRVQDFDRAREIVVYCASTMCKASAAAYQKLKKMGFVRVYAYEGGTKEWKEKGYPVEGLRKLAYLKG